MIEQFENLFFVYFNWLQKRFKGKKDKSKTVSLLIKRGGFLDG